MCSNHDTTGGIVLTAAGTDDSDDPWLSDSVYGRDVAEIPVLHLGKVVRSPGDPNQPWTWVCPEWPRAERAVNRYLRDLHTNDARPDTLRSYAYDIQRWLRFLRAVEVDFDEAIVADYYDFRRFLKHHGKTHGARRPRGTGFQQRNTKTGKTHPDDHEFSQATQNHSRSVLHEWYEFLYRVGPGKPLVNPVPHSVRRERGDERQHAHHNPLEEFRRTRTRVLDGAKPPPRRAPRHIPDSAFDDLWEALTCDRDRALIRAQVDSCARPTEMLGILGRHLDWGTPTATVIRKGTRFEQPLPISPEGMLWLRRYQQEIDYVAGLDEPVFVTMRGPRRQLDYNAYRGLLNRANTKLGTDWTPHDFRHTGAVRMLDAGVPLHIVQEILGHTDPKTTSRYVRPRLDEIVTAQQRYWARPKAQPGPSAYDAADLATLFGAGA